MSAIFFTQTDEPIILLPESGEERVLLKLEIPCCYKHNLFKIDGFFESNFIINESMDKDVSFSYNLEYQLLDGLGENSIELTS
ncbi:hypothetical protein [Chengkuizengella axinellae]|uniref:Uncharacterized protein n=1 Tax=Chengkuizengella axinellae TaxID=3064388 RepID=A0ABT9IXZ4_9BACL|nr:hypothetical protein [Chengkuizengella sp. 2205SS18-9]MDP5274231.1 hypothetical protein [Chengkuizengella sp. 2205SS18-9]